MDSNTQKLQEYITAQIAAGASAQQIKLILLQNEWNEVAIDDAFRTLGINETTQSEVLHHTPASATNNAFKKEALTMDTIIDKFIPIVGALFLIIGFGYLIYANAWVNLAMEIRIGLGLFFSVAIIGGSFSFSDRMSYLADVGIGSGVLLFYGTLVYGSRATELASAMIPEVVTLITAVLFTLTVAYFALKRNSKVILMLGMLGAYITPFVIGQNGVWVDNVSFNAYLIYFLAVSACVFAVGREISVRDIIPLNILGLFVGISTLWGLSATTDALQPATFFSGEPFTIFLFMLIVVFSTWSILLSATRFTEKDDGYLSLGYLAPIIWFYYNANNLESVSEFTLGIMYAFIATSCFIGWYVIRDSVSKYQHTAIYAAGLLSGALAVFTLLDDFNVFTSMAVAYASLVFGVLYVVAAGRAERFVSYLVISFMGALLSIVNILEAGLRYETLLIVIALLPAIAAYFIAKNGPEVKFLSGATLYSIGWSLVALMFVLVEFIEYLDANFLFFYLVPLALLGYLAFGSQSHDEKSRLLPLILGWFGFGYAFTFISLVVNIYPAPTDTFLFSAGGATDWLLIKGIFGTIILFCGLYISRALQAEQVIKRPSFILVIFGFTSLLLTGNYIISAIMNDLQISVEQGGPRAIAVTIWWVAIAIYMLYAGIKLGKKYHSEKLLGLILLGITVVKVILYDIATMGMQNKIIVLMLVGGALLLFSYYLRSKNLVQDTAHTEEVR